MGLEWYPGLIPHEPDYDDEEQAQRDRITCGIVFVACVCVILFVIIGTVCGLFDDMESEMLREPDRREIRNDGGVR